MDVRKIPDEMVFALVYENNARLLAAIGSSFHLRKTCITGGDYRNPTETILTVSAANASDLATSVTLVNQIKGVVNKHFADDVAHNTAVSSAVTTADATDLATGITLANALKAAYGTHRTASNVHYTNDATNTIAAADATDQTSLNTLLNELKTDITAHIAGAVAGVYINLIPA